MATIVTKNSSTASAVPTTSDLVQGELAVNVTDKRIFTENASTQIVELGTNPSTVTTATATVTGTLTANGTFASSNAVITGGSINSTPIGATTPSTIVGSTVTANTGFVGGLTGNVTGNLTGNVTGNVNGNLTGNVTGNVTASSGTTTLNDLVVNGTADFTNTKLTNITTPTVGSDAANKSYVDDTVAAVIDSAPAALDTLNELAAALGDDANFAGTVTTALATKLPLAGGTMTGAIAMGTSKITGLGNPTSAQDAATKTYVDTADALKLNLTGGTMSGAIAMGTNKITGVGNPTLAQDAATKDYVDDILGSATSAATSAAAAATSASNAATSASNAATSATASANSASAAAASYDAFDDRYLGDKASDPTLDNDGNALLTGALYFNTTSDVMKVYDGSAWNIAAISSASPTFTGTVTADGLSLGDNEKATFGNSNDLEIYHNGSNSYVQDTGTGKLHITSNGTGVSIDKGTSELMATFDIDGAVTLYHDSAAKLATTSTGIDVTGTATMDGLTVSTDSYRQLLLTFPDSFTSKLQLGFSNFYLQGSGTTDELTIANNSSGQTKFINQSKTSMLIDNSGDISFYEDTGTTPKFFWDASAERLGIGTTSCDGTLHVHSGSAGSVTAVGGADDLVVENSSSGGISILTPNASNGYFIIGSPSDSIGSQMDWNYDNLAARYGSSSIGAKTELKGDNFVTNLTLSGASGSEVAVFAGNVGIGVVPEAWNSAFPSVLQVGTAASLTTSGGDNARLFGNVWYDGTNYKRITSGYAQQYEQTGGTHRWFYAGTGAADSNISFSEAMRIDSSGNLLVGTTTLSYSTAGARIRPFGQIASTISNGSSLSLNRLSSNGSIIDFSRDGTAVGNIGVWNNDNISLYGNSSHAGIGMATNSVEPIRNNAPADNSVDLGVVSARFKDLYLGGGVYLGGTVAANKLDDYEEGTWTPAYSTSGGSFSYDTATAGSYTKIGNVVTLYFRIYTTATTAGTGDVSITGIPFAEAITSGVGGGSIGDCRLFGGDMPDTLTVLGSAIFPYYRTAANGANTRLQASDLATVGGIQNLIDGQITYITT
jgi:hypothetical protein